MPRSTRTCLRVLAWLFGAALIVSVGLAVFGDRLLIAQDPPPRPVDAAIVLQGSILGERVRLAGAINLLQRGGVDRVLLSVPKESYWGQSIPQAARGYLQRTYGGDLASRVDFCETGDDVNSTRQEAQTVSGCILQKRWQSVVIVTSNYHTRRAGMIWRETTRPHPELHTWIEGVSDPEFQLPWWRHRQAAKMWVMESWKLAWTILGG